MNRSLTFVNDEMVWASPKTSRSRRSLSLDADTVVVLRAHRRRQLEERLNAGKLWQDNDLVFCNETAKALHRDRSTRAFTAAARRSSHDLRHTWRRLALQAGIHPKVVSKRLGHATTGITLDIYSHVQPELDAHAATAVAELFGDKNKGTMAARRG